MQEKSSLAAKLFVKYWLEFSVGAVAVLILLVGIVVSQGGRPSSPVAAPADSTQNLQYSALIPGPTGFSLDSMAYGKTDRVVVLDKSHNVNLKSGESLTLRGWATDSPNGVAASSVVAQVDDIARITQVSLGERADVQNVFNNRNYALCAYTIVIPPSFLPPGTHRIVMLVGNAARTGYYRIPVQISVAVSPPQTLAK